ncbi:zinc finger, CCHC-type containing protein [Tanacetum coccineum]
MITPYELWTKKKPNLNYLRVWGCGAVVRLPDLMLKTLGERGIKCIFIRYAEHSKAFRFYVIEPNESVSINSIIKSMNAIFDENRFSSVPRRSLRIPNGTEDIGGLVVPALKRDEVSDQHSYYFNVEDDPKTFDEAMKSHDVAFWKEAIMMIWIPSWATTLDLIIHQMNVKATFLNGELDKEVYMNQPQGFIMTRNENKVCKLIKSLYGLEQAPKQWHQKFDEVVLSNGYLLNQADKCVNLTKEFLSSRFSIKDMGEADVILGIRIKHESNRISISQSHYSEKVLKKFNYFDCNQVSTLMDTSEKMMPNNVGKLSRYTSNLGIQHWQAIQWVLKYLKKTIDYSLTYTGYPSILEGYTNAS